MVFLNIKCPKIFKIIVFGSPMKMFENPWVRGIDWYRKKGKIAPVDVTDPFLT